MVDAQTRTLRSYFASLPSDIAAQLISVDLKQVSTDEFVTSSSLSPVATSGLYSDLSGRPTLGALAAKDNVGISDISATGTPSNTTYLRGDGSWGTPAGGGGGSGTVTSVDLTVPTGLSVAGGPIITSGSFAITYAAGYQGFTTAQSTKLGYLTVTQATDLDAIRTRVLELDQAVIIKGSWNPTSGTFPGAGAAQAGWAYLVSADGTVGGVAFNQNDRIIAIVDNASTTVFAANWFKEDYTDQVLSVAGKTGAVTLAIADVSGLQTALDAKQATMTKGVANDVRAGTDDAAYLTALALTGSAAVITLTDASTVAWNMASGYNAKVTLGGNRTVGVPTNPKEGIVYTLQVIQDGTGSRTGSWNTCFDFGSAGTPTLSTGAGKIDIVSMICIDAATPKFRCSFNKAA